MGKGAEKQNVTVQYCMTFARMVLQVLITLALLTSNSSPPVLRPSPVAAASRGSQPEVIRAIRCPGNALHRIPR